MRASWSLIRREFAGYFLSPVGYVAIVLFLAGMGVLFRLTFSLLSAEGAKGIEFPMQGLFGNVGFWLIFWVIPPVLTMRLFAEERSTGTLEMLLTAPIRDRQVVVCKYLACLALYIVMWIPTLAYLPVLLDMKFESTGWQFGIDPMPVAATYLGLFLAGSMFIALGLWVSSLVRSQIVAALLALAVNLVFILGGLLVLGGFYAPSNDWNDLAYRTLNFLSVPLHVSQDFGRGIIDTRHVILYVSVTLAALFLTVRSLERRRWQ